MSNLTCPEDLFLLSHLPHLLVVPPSTHLPRTETWESSSLPLVPSAPTFSKPCRLHSQSFPQSHSAPALPAAFLFLRHAELIPPTSEVLPSDTLVKLTSARGPVLVPTPTSSSSSGSVFFRACFLYQVFSCLLTDLLRCYIFSAPFTPPTTLICQLHGAGLC